MKNILAKLLLAANGRGPDVSDIHKAVSDHRTLLRAAWGLMTAGQKALLLQDPEVVQVVQSGAVGDLHSQVRQTIANMEAAAVAAGYSFHENELGHYWEVGEFEGTPHLLRDDAIEAAFRDIGSPR